MPMTPYSGDVEIITNIGTTPQERGLSTDEFKAKFDEGLKAYVTWFNDTHKTEFDAHEAESASKHITESGSNANGKYIRFDDGTQICISPEIIATNISTAIGSIFRGGTAGAGIQIWTFPASFSSLEYAVTVNALEIDLWADIYQKTKTNCRIVPYSPVSKSTDTTLMAVAIGRWK